MSKSSLERSFLTQLKWRGLPQPESEVQAVPGRRFRFDFAWVEQKVALEIDGGVYSNGRHVRGKQYGVDCAKANLAQLNGWLILRCTGDHLETGEIFEWVSDALELRSA